MFQELTGFIERMEVFCDEQEIRFALIKAFPGTNLNCNDANGCVKEII